MLQLQPRFPLRQYGDDEPLRWPLAPSFSRLTSAGGCSGAPSRGKHPEDLQ